MLRRQVEAAPIWSLIKFMEAAEPARVDRLTDRQKDCLRLVGQGYTSKQIGPRLGISHVTVDNYIRTALELLQAESRAGAARMLVAHELDQPLIHQPPGLAAEPHPHSEIPLSDTGRSSRFVPPLGGQRNTLPAEGKVYAILKVAVLGLSGLFALTLALAALLWLLR
nr:helix-turn-helix transcriptional regulator [uncultured Sphingomonas sp.]